MRVLENPYSCIFYAMYSFIYHRCRNNVCSLVISDYFHHKATKQLWIKDSKMSGLKDFNSFQENFSLSLAKRKLNEINEWKFSNQSGEVMYAFIRLTNCRRSLFFGCLM